MFTKYFFEYTVAPTAYETGYERYSTLYPGPAGTGARESLSTYDQDRRQRGRPVVSGPPF